MYAVVTLCRPAVSGSLPAPRRISMHRLARAAAALAGAALLLPASAFAQAITALPDQTSTIRLSNRDVNHIVCVGGEIEDVKFSDEKAIAVERAGSDRSEENTSELPSLKRTSYAVICL